MMFVIKAIVFRVKLEHIHITCEEIVYMFIIKPFFRTKIIGYFFTCEYDFDKTETLFKSDV